jgi:hypothetical protein
VVAEAVRLVHKDLAEQEVELLVSVEVQVQVTMDQLTLAVAEAVKDILLLKALAAVMEVQV